MLCLVFVDLIGHCKNIFNDNGPGIRFTVHAYVMSTMFFAEPSLDLNHSQMSSFNKFNKCNVPA